MSQPRRVLAAGLIGSAIEWYEFFIYGTAASLVFGKLFFPDFDPVVGTLLALSTFAVGFVARPIGSVVFGHFGDRLGRKSMLVITLVMMGVATTLTGLLPTYESIGIWAPILLVVLRIVQGFSLGGEYGGAVLMSVEHAGPRKRGLYGAVVNTGVGWGLLLATIVFLGLSQLSDEAFYSWGWRVPFLSSIVLVGIGLVIRLKLEESPDFEKARQTGEIQKLPIAEVLRKYPVYVVLMCLAYLSSGVTFYIATVFSLSYGTKTLGESRSTLLGLISISVCIVMAGMIYFGWLSDRVSRRAIFFVGLVGMTAAPWAWFALLGTGDWPLMLLGFALLLIPYAANYGIMPAYFVAVFPAHIRYTGLSLGYTLGAVLAGGTAPIIATFLFGEFGDWHAIALYMSATGVLSMIGAIFLRERYTGNAPSDAHPTTATAAAETREPVIAPNAG
jgi:metabolite-proton symporter